MGYNLLKKIIFFTGASKSDWKPVYRWATGASAKEKAESARVANMKRKDRIKFGKASIDEALTPFNNQYYAQKVKNYTDFTGADLAQQTEASRDALLRQLSQSGIGKSSMAGWGLGQLANESAQARANNEATGFDYEAGLKNKVEDIRSSLVSQLKSSADASQAAQQSNQQAAQLIQRPDYLQPIAGAFSNLASLYKGDQLAALSAKAAGNQYNSPFGGMFSFGRNNQGSASKVIPTT